MPPEVALAFDFHSRNTYNGMKSHGPRMDYKDTLLSNLESLLYDVLSEDTITPSDIHDTLTRTVKESYYYHKHHTARSYELLEKLSHHNPMTYTEMIEKGYTMTADGFWIPPQSNTFTTTIETDPITNEPYLTLPPELLERLNWTEGTQLELTFKDDTLHITRA